MRSGGCRTAALAACIALLAPAGPAAAYAPESTPDRKLEAATIDAATSSAASGAKLAAMLMRDGVPVVRRNAGSSMIPASLMKLATTVAAVHRLGPDHRFVTRVRSAGGSAARPARLYLIGGGDSTFSTNRYRKARFLPDEDDPVQRPAFASGSPTVEQLAARIDAAGVTRVTGDLIVDETLFDKDRVPAGWPSRYFGYSPESGYSSALTVNENRTDVRRTGIDPQPAIQAGRELRRALSRRGISIGGGIRYGTTPSGARSVASVSSPPLEEIVDFINRYSANFQAEILFKATAAEIRGLGTYANGERVVRGSLSSLGVSLSGFNAEDGSGLSRSNRMTARTIADLLDAILRRPALSAVKRSIPVAGKPGTLRTRLTRSPTGGNLRGKTGLLRGVRGLAGWVTGVDGTPIVYVALYNNARSALALTGPLDLFSLAAALHPSV